MGWGAWPTAFLAGVGIRRVGIVVAIPPIIPVAAVIAITAIVTISAVVAISTIVAIAPLENAFLSLVLIVSAAALVVSASALVISTPTSKSTWAW